MSPSIRPANEANTPTDLLNDLRNLVLEAEKMLASSVTDSTGEALQALRDRYDAAQKRLGVLCTDAKKQVVAGAKCTDEAIRSHPYPSIMIATGVGLLIGLLLRRRSA